MTANVIAIPRLSSGELCCPWASCFYRVINKCMSLFILKILFIDFNVQTVQMTDFLGEMRSSNEMAKL